MRAMSLISVAVLASLTLACGGDDGSAIDAAPIDAARPDATNCYALPNFDQCFACVQDQDPAGIQAYNQAVIDQCLCANECQAQCTNDCQSGSITPNSACETCFNNVAGDSNSACVQGFLQQCSNNADCTRFVTSLQNCP